MAANKKRGSYMDDTNQVIVPPERLDDETEAALDVLVGRWEIVETEVWDKDALDLEETWRRIWIS